MNRKTARTKFSVLALALSMSCTALGSSMTQVLAAEAIPSAVHTQTKTNTRPAAQETLPAIEAKGGYAQVQIAIDRAEDDTNTYSILRADSENGSYVSIGETTESIWIDTMVQTETTYFYKLQKGSEISSTPIETSTGKEAYLHQSVLNKALNESESVFDGTRVVDLSDSIGSIKNLEEGSVYIRFKSENATDSALRHLLTYHNCANPEDMSNTNASYSTDKIFYLALDYRNGTHKLRADLTGGAKATNGSGYGDGQWHTLILTSRADNPTFGVSVDGVSVLSYSQAAFKGLFTRLVNADRLQIGGYKPADTVYEGFKGEISQVAISSEALTTAQANALTSAEQSRFKKDMFSLDEIGNTWMFVGGEEVAANYEHVQGLRSFVYHFEEYARWEKPRQMSTAIEPLKIGHSHFVANAGKTGNTLSDTVSALPDSQNAFHARTIVYTAGIEDIQEYVAAPDKNVWKNSYQTALTSLKNAIPSNGYLVIQTPHACKDAQKNAAAKEIADLIQTHFAADLGAEPNAQNVFVVDQYTHSNTDTFKSTCLNADDQLNGYGHFEIARILENATGQSTTSDYNAGNLDDCIPVDQPAYHDLANGKEALQASFENASLELTLASSDVLGGSDWILHAENGEVELSTPVQANASVSLPVKDGSWTLRLISEDGTAELPAYSISKGEASLKRQSTLPEETALSDTQKRIRDLLKSDKKLNWIFYGDSITHGCRHTRGYDTIVQLFDKYMHAPDGLNRPDDLILNTAVSGAIAQDTLSDPHKKARIESYVPDVAIVMLGMNDCAASGITPDVFEAQLKENLATIKKQNPDVEIILRACNVTTASGRGNLKQYIAKVRKVAQEENYILADHATTWEAAMARQTNANQGGTGNLNSDGLHPNGIGHKVMFDDLTRAMGIYDTSSPICRLQYKMNQKSAQSDRQPVCQTGIGELSLDLTALVDPGKTAGTAEVTVTAAGFSWTKTYDIASPDDRTTLRFTNLPAGKSAVVNVKIATTDATVTTYTPATVEIPSKTEPANIVFSKAEGGYAQAVLEFENPTNASVTILRSSSLNGTYAEIETVQSGSYTDQVEPDQTWFYKLRWNDGEEQTSQAREVKTGMEAYKASAQVYEALSGQTFDGQTLIDLSDQADSVKAMNAGSLFFRFKTDAATDSMALVYGKEAGTTTSLIQTGGGQMNRHSISLRPLQGKLSLRPDLAHTRADGNTEDLGDGQWHNVVLVCTSGPDRTFTWYIDGKEVQAFSGAGNAGFFSTLAGLNQLTLGGYYNGSNIATVINGFKGEMRDVIFSTECLNQTHSQKITDGLYSETDPEPEPTLITDLLDAALQKADALNGLYINQDQNFDEKCTQARSVLENPQRQSEIDQSAKTLNQALLALRKVPSVNALSNLKSVQ